ncbi:MAG: ABC transporter substrate-binding protein [Anaerolineae bacterium]|nr:ABC transporter substrate-binding protein [Anaerolineae bacterium]
MKKHLLLMLIVLILLSSLIGCAPQNATPAATSLKVTALPILDTLPVLVAQDQGLFAKYNLTVEFIPAGSAPEREQLIASGQADGQINEVVSAMFNNKEKANVKVVRYARASAPGAALFSLLANPQAGVTSPADLAGKSVGISEGTVIEYVTQRLLEAEGVDPAAVKFVSVPKIDARLALLNSGELQAAVLPEPLASAAALGGSTVVLADSSHPEYSFSTWTFRTATLEENPEAVKAFLKGLEEAVTLINADPNRWKPLLAEQKILPPSLADSFVVPAFVKAGVPTPEQYADALAWAKDKGYLSVDVAYDSTVTAEFLP